MTIGKRLMDIVLALLLAVLLAPVIIGLALAVLVIDGRPVFFGSLRARSPGQNFRLWKLRTMTNDSADAGVTGGDKQQRITRMGGFLRRTRLDEFPQLWNILKGDISFVGPRPPLPRYVEMFPETYAKVLKSRPGVTGLATLAYHKTEENLLKSCQTAEETEAVYVCRCIPRKAQIDLLYAKNRTLCSDLVLILVTGGGRRWWRKR
ncbi:MAG TPA: sugar transferase [Rhodobacterales bacterium]|nr:sugar transferase [Rhodobacterales bacterium]